MPPPPPLFPHIVGSRHGATEPPMRTAPSRRAEQCRTPRAERAACRRYAIMVSPTQSVPEVLAVWGSDYKIAIVCRRYTIMVAQNPTTNPHTSQTPSQIPTTHHKPHHKSPPHIIIIHDPTIIAYLRHAARSTRHLTAPRPPPTTHKKNEQQARRLNCSFPLSTAVRTRLELATPCVTGMYSNQLNYRTSCRVCITAFFRFACAKLLLFPHSRKFFSKKFAFYPIFL